MNLTTDEMIHQDTTRRAVRSNHSQVMNHHHYNMYYTVQRFMLARVKFKYEVNKHRSQYSSLNAAPSMLGCYLLAIIFLLLLPQQALTQQQSLLRSVSRQHWLLVVDIIVGGGGGYRYCTTNTTNNQWWYLIILHHPTTTNAERSRGKGMMMVVEEEDVHMNIDHLYNQYMNRYQIKRYYYFTEAWMTTLSN